MTAVAALLALAVWSYLFFGRGGFWRSTPELRAMLPVQRPDVDVIVPARDEAPTIAAVIDSLLRQDYPGTFRVVLVDDGSSDATAELAQRAAVAALHSAEPAQRSAVAALHSAEPAPRAAVAALHGAELARGTAPHAAAAPGDRTPQHARPAAAGSPDFVLITAPPKADGWSGKLWALAQGVAAGGAPLLLFTDADIVHDPRHLSTLVEQLTARRLDLVSEMVRLRCESLAERLLVPAFVYFFQMLYPFANVNDARSPVAAAAGGTVLIRREALERAGGIAAIKGALIDDVSLARAVKAGGARAGGALAGAARSRDAEGQGGGERRPGSIYLGHSGLAASIRPYPHFADVWGMIARTAFTQLRHSIVMLAGTLASLALVFLVPAAALLSPDPRVFWCGAVAAALTVLSYQPTLARYRRSPLWALLLPAIAVFFGAATLGSAVRHWRGAGASWKNRAYGATPEA